MFNFESINKSFYSTLIDSNLDAALKEVTEKRIDYCMEAGVLKDIPIVRTLLGCIKTTQNVSNYLFLKKIVSFLSEIGDVPQEKRQKEIDKIDKSEKYRIKVGEKLLYILEQCEDHIKAAYIARWFRAFLKEEISYDSFLEGSSIINRLTTTDFDFFIFKDKIDEADSELIGSGLAYITVTPVELNTHTACDYDEVDNVTASGGEIYVRLNSIAIKLLEVFRNDKLD